MSNGGPVLRRKAGRGRKAVAMVEFALLLPMFLFFLLFIIDVGNMTMQQAALQDATQQAAREGAQIGYAVGGGSSVTGPGAGAFYAAVDAIPGMELERVERFEVLQGDCSAWRYIEVRAGYKVRLLTPGLNGLMRLVTGQTGSIGEGWILDAKSVARCEVVLG